MRVGLAGAGLIASVHGLAAKACTNAAVTHVASRTDERARALAAQFGAKVAALTDLPADVDAVVVATPPASHADHALAAAAAGTAALVEKPLACTLDEADRLVAAAADGAYLAYGENLIHAPAVRAAVVATRELGRLDHIEVRALQDRPTWGDFLTARWGGGVLFDLGVHPLAVALLLAGDDRVVEVEAALSGADDHPTDEHADVRLRFSSGLTAHVEASWRSPVHLWDAQAASPTGAVRFELVPEPLVERDGEPLSLPAPRVRDAPMLDSLGYVTQLETMASEIAARRPAMCGMAFGRAVLDIVCAAYTSARTATPEPVPFTGPRDRTPLELWRPEVHA